MRNGPKIAALVSIMALGAATLTPAAAGPTHRAKHLRANPAAESAFYRGPNVTYSYGPGYSQGYYDHGFNPIAGVIGAAATVATAPLAIATGGYAPYGYGYGYYGAPGWGYDDYGSRAVYADWW